MKMCLRIHVFCVCALCFVFQALYANLPGPSSPRYAIPDFIKLSVSCGTQTFFVALWKCSGRVETVLLMAFSSCLCLVALWKGCIYSILYWLIFVYYYAQSRERNFYTDIYDIILINAREQHSLNKVTVSKMTDTIRKFKVVPAWTETVVSWRVRR